MKNSESDSNLVICPYCGSSYQPEAEEFDEQEREEECGKCGKTYLVYNEFSVTHYTRTAEETK